MNFKRMYEGIMIISISMLILFILLDILLKNLYLVFSGWLLGLSFGIAFERRFLAPKK